MEMGNLGEFRPGNFSVGNRVVSVTEVFRSVSKCWQGPSIQPPKVFGSVFVTQSVRTRCSFERAAIDLGMGVITVTERRDNEPLRDFGFAVAQSCDLCVVRLWGNDFEEFVSDIDIPVIDGGQGTKSHPTQALVDLYTLVDNGILPPARIGLFGPPENRTMHSFRQLASQSGYRCFEFMDQDLFSCRKEYDVIYGVTFGNWYGVERSIPKGLTAKIMHPFPRGKVVPSTYDFTDQDLYHQQMKNAIRVRRALCAVLLDSM